MKKRKLERLRLLAEVVLPAVKPEEFNLDVWKSIRPDGTEADAIGHATSYEPFAIAGLELAKMGDTGLFYPIFDGLSGLEAVKAFFDLTNGEACWLFCPAWHLSREKTQVNEVIERIESLLDWEQNRCEDEEPPVYKPLW